MSSRADERSPVDEFAAENQLTVESLSEMDPLAAFASEQDPIAPLTRRRRSRAAVRIAVGAAVVALAASVAYLYPATQVPLNDQIAAHIPAPVSPVVTVEPVPVVSEESVPVVADEPDPVATGGRNATEPSPLSGAWLMNTRVESSGVNRYEGLRLGYRITLRQDGNRISGSGWKVSEDNRAIGKAARTPITLAGTLDADRAELTFTERGKRRVSGGTLLLVRASENTLRGRFSSDAAQSSGAVEIHR